MQVGDMVLDEVRRLLGSALQLGGASAKLTADSPLLGAIPELDSMAVVTLIAAIEDHFGVSVSDDEINADTFETLGSLTAFVAKKSELS